MLKTLSYNQMTDMIPISKLKENDYDEVVAVMRGGMTAAHYIAKQLRLSCGAYFPSSPNRPCELVLANPNSNYILFVEDLVAQGRTLQQLNEYMQLNLPHVAYDFLPIVVDKSYNDNNYLDINQKHEDWIVFPYEMEDKVKEGDRGLFRERSDVYGK